MKNILIYLILSTFLIISCKISTDINKNNENRYDKLWEEVYSFENKGLPKSSKAKVEDIYNIAKKENNTSQIIKSIIHIIKYRKEYEENTLVKVIIELEEMNQIYSSPTKEILYSVMAELYWNYYQNNRYKFMNRTETKDFNENDIRYWDLRKLVRKVTELYLKSLENSELLKSKRIDEFEEILVSDKKNRQRRPTLYDFLIYRAISYFSNTETELIEPFYKFELMDERLFESPEKFINLEIETEDKESFKYITILLYKDLLRFHLNDKEKYALFDADINRIIFVKNNFIKPNKEILYLKYLNNIKESYKESDLFPEVTLLIGKYHLDLGSKYIPEIAESYKWEKKKALEILQEAIEKYPEAISSNHCRYFISEITQKKLFLDLEKVYIPEKPFLYLLKYKNIDKVYIKIIEEKNYLKGEENPEQKIKEKAIFTEEINLIDDGDYNEHSVELKIPSLKPGYYYIFASPEQSFNLEKKRVCYSSFWVSTISFVENKKNNGNIDLYILNRETGEPLSNVIVNIYENIYDNLLRKYKFIKTEEYKSDSNGYVEVLNKYNKYRSIFYEFIYKEEKLFNDYDTYQYENEQKSNTTITKTFFFTDRSIYRPGQTIYFKGIVIKSENKNSEIIPNKDVEIILNNVNKENIATLHLKTNEYGTFNGTFTIPTESLNGLMTIYNLDNSGYINISVEEYKRPKFEVLFEPVKESFVINDKVKIKGIAKSYAGSNIDNAMVKYRVVRKSSFPYIWWWWDIPVADIQIVQQSTKTDENGRFTIEFDAIPDYSISEDKNPLFNYYIYVDVTDINGETHSATSIVSVGYVALKVSTDLKDTILKDDPLKIKIFSLNLNNEFEEARGKITISKLKEPKKYYKNRIWNKPDKFLIPKEKFEKDFPFDQYEDELNFYKWEKDKEVFNSDFNTKENDTLLLNSIQHWESGKYTIEIQTKDKYGKPIIYKKYFTVYSVNDNKNPLKNIFFLSNIKNKGEPGENALFEIGTSTENLNIFYFIESNEKIVKNSRFILSDSKEIVEIPIKEEDRGNLFVHFFAVKHNRYFYYNNPIYVNWKNKELNIEFETFRDKLFPGEKEEWRIKISGYKKDKVAAEMVATLYDASLNAFKLNNWYLNIYPYNYSKYYFKADNNFLKIRSSTYYEINSYESFYNKTLSYDYLNWFGLNFEENDYYYLNGRKSSKSIESTFESEFEPEKEYKSKDNSFDSKDNKIEVKEESEKKEEIQIRKDFAETAFFYPELKTDNEGRIIISFKIPDSLTRWKMLGFAHTKDLEYGFIEKELSTQKDLMIMTNMPRFLRENDKIILTAKISNISNKDLTGIATLQLFDANSLKSVDNKFNNKEIKKNFSIKQNQSGLVSWELDIPQNLEGLTYKIIAKANDFSDGEEAILPILPNRILVTESISLPIRTKGQKEFKMEKLISAKKSSTLSHYNLVLEFTSNPVWLAIQSLPYLMEYPYECSEQIFSRIYANSIAINLANSDPLIRDIYESWKNTEALQSNLEKNQEVKNILLEETPWVLDARNESERKKMIGILFDLTKMDKEITDGIKKLSRLQLLTGGFSWFLGLPDDRFITQHIISGFGRLKKLKVDFKDNKPLIYNMCKNGIKYLDDRMREDYEYLIKNKIPLKDNNLSYLIIHYLYTRSLYNDITISSFNKKAYEYWLSQIEKYWLDFNIYCQAMIAMTLFSINKTQIANDIIKSLKEKATIDDEMGMYWVKNFKSIYWYEAPIETQVLLIEAFNDITKDKNIIDEMKIWLLKNKHTNNWGTTKATTDAIYALMLTGSNWFKEDNLVTVQLGDFIIDPVNDKDIKPEKGTGYFKKIFDSSKIKEDMGNITVNKNFDGISWGALYWQYYEQLDKITEANTSLKLRKRLFVKRYTPKGAVLEPIENIKVRIGDEIIVRIELEVERDMEYIHLKDARASCLEPINILSSYKYQDGLWYYEVTKDGSTNFFIPYLLKGSYLFEYSLRVTHKGDFSNGITTIQCMYAPEFNSHSKGERIKVE